MNLVWFLTIATLISLVLGEFGQLPFGSPTSVSVSDLLLTVTLIFLMIWKIGIKKQVNVNLPIKLLALFWVAGLLSLVISGNFLGGLYLIRFVVYSLSFWLGKELIDSKVTNKDKIIKLFVYISLTLSIIGFLQLLIYPDLEALTSFGFDPHKGRLVSTFLDPNLLGIFLNFGLIGSFYLYSKEKTKDFAFFGVLIFAALILTYSRSAYAMFFIEVLILGFLRHRKILIALVLLLAILYLFLPRFSERIKGGFLVDKSAIERVESWNKGIYVFQKNPVTGVGLNNLREAYQRYGLFKVFSENGGNSGSGVDSSFIFILATTGVVGLVTYIIFWGIIIINLCKRLFSRFENFALFLFSIIAGLFFSSQFVNALFFSPVVLLLYLIMGASYEKGD